MPIQYQTDAGVMTHVTATQTGVLSIGKASNPAALIGILVGSVLTAPSVQIWHGQVTAAGATMIGTITCAANAFTKIPAICSGGATFYVSGVVSPDLTIYWNPLGGGV